MGRRPGSAHAQADRLTCGNGQKGVELIVCRIAGCAAPQNSPAYRDVHRRLPGSERLDDATGAAFLGIAASGTLPLGVRRCSPTGALPETESDGVGGHTGRAPKPSRVIDADNTWLNATWIASRPASQGMAGFPRLRFCPVLAAASAQAGRTSPATMRQDSPDNAPCGHAPVSVWGTCVHQFPEDRSNGSASCRIVSNKVCGNATPSRGDRARAAWRRSPGRRAPSIPEMASKSRCARSSQSFPPSAAGSIARMNSPPGGGHAPPGKESAVSTLSISPIIGPASNSTMSARAEPLYPPNGSWEPASTVAGSVLGAPSGPTPAPGGRVLPSLSAIMISPRAIAEVAISNTSGSPPGRGHPNEIGLVPNVLLDPPAGVTTGR